jgi:DNA topoisomerase-1
MTPATPPPRGVRQKLAALSRRLGRAARRHDTAALKLEPAEAAAAGGLRYVSDLRPGIRRTRKGKAFTYAGPDGKAVRDRETLGRIASLVIPPAWRDVWICPDPKGHLQATGKDARGRKQYRYHPLWRQVRDLTKYHRMVPFGEALPAIRARVDHDLRAPELSRTKVLAAVVRLLEETLIRVGNEEYAKQNHSYGLTTLHDSHVKILGDTLRFHFRGKSGKIHTVAVHDARVARIVRGCQELPGHELFQYVDDRGVRHDVTSEDVNAYLHEITGEEFTAKDFRTWAGTVQAALNLRGLPPCTSAAQAKRNVVSAIKSVSETLGNTPAVCRKCYVHPGIVDAYQAGSLLPDLERHWGRGGEVRGLRFGEAAVLGLLRDCFTKTA